jgi:transposase-like protein
MNAPVIQSKQTRRKFDKTFKQNAVELWLNSGKTATEVAAELGIDPQRLGAWRERLAPNNWRLKTPNCGARTIICANSGIF